MKLSAIITDYRHRMKISQREFARACNLSNSYISFLENESNPRTGRPIVPTLDQYRKISTGMQMTVHQLFKIMDEDSPVDISVPCESLENDNEEALLDLYRQLSPDGQRIAIERVQELVYIYGKKDQQIPGECPAASENK